MIDKSKCKMANQKGTVLIFGVLITSIILVMGAGVSVFIISEIVSTRKIDNSIIAYYTAECGIEHGLFEIRKKGKTINNIDMADIQVAGAGSWTRIASNKDNDIFIPLVEVGGNFYINLYDPDAEDVNGVIDYHAGVDALTIECQNGSSLLINCSVWDPEMSSLTLAIPNYYMHCNNGIHVISFPLKNRAYRFYVQAAFVDAKDIIIKAYDDNDVSNPANQIEIINKNIINSTGTYVNSKAGVRAEMDIDPPW
ncbi:MAG: hypothetical protein U9O55_00495 [Patescibacteria group bacterium]|nr:hypothetical protein [Patescibacteria group bacterium]